MNKFPLLLVSPCLLLSSSFSGKAAQKQSSEAKAAELTGGALKMANLGARGGYAVNLSQPRQSI